jgi:transposase
MGEGARSFAESLRNNWLLESMGSIFPLTHVARRKILMAEPIRRLRYADHHFIPPPGRSLDQLLPDDHVVRGIWRFVQQLDLTPLLEPINALPGQAGAPAIDPRILLALWLYATLQGVGSSYQLEEFCRDHTAYRWLCGGQTISQRTLSGFRTAHTAFLNDLLTHSAAVLIDRGVATLEEVAQDGLRVRASAGTSSFHQAPTLAACLVKAQQQVAQLRTQLNEDPGAVSRRAAAAQQRQARERLARVEEALTVLARLQAHHDRLPKSQQQQRHPPRCSTTDPAARKMKMPDGGYRPAYNVQFATTVGGGVIVAAAVNNAGTDANQLPPLLEQIEERLGEKPQRVLVDGGFADVDSITQAEQDGVTVYAPVRGATKQLEQGNNPYARKRGDTDEYAAWRARMGTAAAQACYRRRGQTAEWVNAQVRNRGLYQVTVRGVDKVRAVVLWQAVTHNMCCLLRREKQERQAQRRERAKHRGDTLRREP